MHRSTTRNPPPHTHTHHTHVHIYTHANTYLSSPIPMLRSSLSPLVSHALPLIVSVSLYRTRKRRILVLLQKLHTKLEKRAGERSGARRQRTQQQHVATIITTQGLLVCPPSHSSLPPAPPPLSWKDTHRSLVNFSSHPRSLLSVHGVPATPPDSLYYHIGRKRSQLQRESGSRGGGSAAPEGDRGKDTAAADHPEVMYLLVRAHFLFLAYTHIHTY